MNTPFSLPVIGDAGGVCELLQWGQRFYWQRRVFHHHDEERMEAVVIIIARQSNAFDLSLEITLK